MDSCRDIQVKSTRGSDNPATPPAVNAARYGPVSESDLRKRIVQLEQIVEQLTARIAENRWRFLREYGGTLWLSFVVSFRRFVSMVYCG
jgi:hypothetical protein